MISDSRVSFCVSKRSQTEKNKERKPDVQVVVLAYHCLQEGVLANSKYLTVRFVLYTPNSSNINAQQLSSGSTIWQSEA